MNDFNFRDENENGIPDIVDSAEEAVKKASLVSRTFTKRNLYLSIIIGVIIAGYGLFGYMYMTLRDEKIAIQNQYNWFQSEQEIEINKAKMEERRRVLNELGVEYGTLKKDLDAKRTKVDKHINKIEDKDFAKEIKNEIEQMDIVELRESFSKFGYKPK
jgi:flagellar basal body-associated protein FliL